MRHHSAVLTNGHISLRRAHDSVTRDRVRVQSSFIDGVKKFFDDIAFENWAPRSSRTWRLNLPPKETTTPIQNATDSDKTKLWESLEQEIVRSYNEEPLGPVPIEEEEESVSEEGPSFSESSDVELNEALNERILGMGDEKEKGTPQRPLTGMELRKLIFAKYQRTYDISFARRDLWGKPLVSLNIMWNHLEQTSFPLSERQLMEKYDRFALYLNAWEQAEKVRDFLTAPRKSKGGLPSRPIMGIAVSFQLDLPQYVISEWFDKN